MPNYEYKCVKCQQVLEAFFPIADGPKPAVICDCGGEAFRFYEPVPAHFKGGGWGGK